MAIATNDLSAPKLAANLSFDHDLEGIIEQSRRELQRAAESWNSFGQDHGSFADEFSTL